ncbi:hypothetical protein IAT38_000351 [Cryptococcus sp. DSM 104549]
MSSYFPFSASSNNLSFSATPTTLDDPHLEVTVTPSASAFYAGETFSVTITFRNTRTPSHDAAVPKTPLTVPPTADPTTAASQTRQLPSLDREPVTTQHLPHRLNQIGLGLPPIPLTSDGQDQNAEAGPSRARTPLSVSTPRFQSDDPGYPYSPGANPAYRAPGWPGAAAESPQREGMMSFRSPDGWGTKENGGVNGAGEMRELGHTRRARSLALGKGTMSPQEMVWALGGQPAPPPLPSRRPPGGAGIPAHHPHSRKISITNPIPSAASTEIVDATSPPLNPIAERNSAIVGDDTFPSSRSSPSPSPSADGSTRSFSTPIHESVADRVPPLSPSPSRTRPAHNRAPSCHNAYGASYLPPPPTHPYIRERPPVEPRGTTNILWAYTRLVAHFHPSNTYIPPDPLLPLRAQLLHQPVGSGSLFTPGSSSVNNPAGKTSSSSRWQLSFGTGTIGNSTQPSLTGSLFGLAKELVMGGNGGSLEEERKRVWNMKDLPVLETTRSLLGVDLKLKEGERKDFTYTLPLPTTLPPAHKGKAFRFSYDLIVSVNVGLPGGGHRQKSKDIIVPIRVWANVSVGHPFRTYDVLHPVIQTKEEGTVTELDGTGAPAPSPASPALSSREMSRRPSSASERLRIKTGDTADSLQAYAHHLLDTLDANASDSPTSARGRTPPLSPSRSRMVPRSRIASPSSPVFNLPEENGEPLGMKVGLLGVPDSAGGVKLGKGLRPRQGSFVEGDDELVEEGGDEGGCGQAVEILSRHSPKASYDIAKEGEMVAVLTLIKTMYRLGETVLGVVTFNDPHTERRVLKFSAYLESHELIPEPLLPPSVHPGPPKQPPLARLHAEHHSSYAVSASRIAFSLDIPSDATPAFSLAAGEGDRGGLEWRVKLSFTVAMPPHGWRKHHRKAAGSSGEKTKEKEREARDEAVHMLPSEIGHGQSQQDGDNRFYAASTTLVPLLSTSRSNGMGSGDKGRIGVDAEKEWFEMRTELVECEVPVKVLAGNTAFVVRPSVWVV